MAVLDVPVYEDEVGFLEKVRVRLEKIISFKTQPTGEKLDEYGYSFTVNENSLKVLKIEYDSLIQYEFSGKSCHHKVKRILAACKQGQLMTKAEIASWCDVFGLTLTDLD